MPTAAVRQATKLPDGGATITDNDNSSWRKAVLAGMVTSPQGVLGSPTTSKATLG